MVLEGIQNKESFVYFLEFLYCDKFVRPITCSQLRGVEHICRALELWKSAHIIHQRAEIGRQKLDTLVKKEVS